jgi:hypothetical protein
MAAMGLDPIGLDQIGPGVIGFSNVLGDDTLAILCGASADGLTQVEPCDPVRLVLGDTSAGVEAQPPLAFVEE